MKVWIAAALALLLGACAVDYPMLGSQSPVDTFLHGYGPAVKKFPGPDGRTGYSIQCGSGARAGECYQAAAKLCSGGYEVLTRGENYDGAVMDVLCRTSPQ